MQFDLSGKNPNFLSGFDISGAGILLKEKFPLDLKGFFILNRFSYFLYETNWGVNFTAKPGRFVVGLGTNFKTYSINSEGVDKYNIPREDKRLRENFNLIYLISGFIKPHDSNWNLGLSVTNTDYYNVNQSTNPFFNLQTICKIKSDLTLFAEAWYKQAGVFNISANYFGYFFRGGLIWKL